MQMNQINLTSTSNGKIGNWAEPESDLHRHLSAASFYQIWWGPNGFLHFLLLLYNSLSSPPVIAIIVRVNSLCFYYSVGK